MFFSPEDERAVSETLYKLVAEAANVSSILTPLERVSQRWVALTLARCFEDEVFFRERFEDVAPYLTLGNLEFDSPDSRLAYGVALGKAIKAALVARVHQDRLKEICRQWEGRADFLGEVINELNLLALTPEEAAFLLATVPCLVDNGIALLSFLERVVGWYRAGTLTTDLTKTSEHVQVVIAILDTLRSVLTSDDSARDDEVLSRATRIYEEVQAMPKPALGSAGKNFNGVLDNLFSEVSALLHCEDGEGKDAT